MGPLIVHVRVSLSAAWVLFALTAPNVQPTGEVRFMWAMGVLPETGGAEQLVPLTSRTVLAEGDRLKLFLHLATPAFPYVVLRSQAGTATLIYPGAVPTPAAQAAGADIFIPNGADWFHLPREASINVLYVIVAAERLPEIETVFAEKRETTAELALAALNRVRGRIGTVRSAAERPADIGGRRRAAGYESRLAAMAMESSGNRLVVKTFTLERR